MEARRQASSAPTATAEATVCFTVSFPMEGPLGIVFETDADGRTAVVRSTVPGSQAEQAGVARGDRLCFPGTKGEVDLSFRTCLDLGRCSRRPLSFDVKRGKRGGADAEAGVDGGGATDEELRLIDSAKAAAVRVLADGCSGIRDGAKDGEGSPGFQRLVDVSLPHFPWLTEVLLRRTRRTKQKRGRTRKRGTEEAAASEERRSEESSEKEKSHPQQNARKRPRRVADATASARVSEEAKRDDDGSKVARRTSPRKSPPKRSDPEPAAADTVNPEAAAVAETETETKTKTKMQAVRARAKTKECDEGDDSDYHPEEERKKRRKRRVTITPIWEARLKELAQYKSEYGHCHVSKYDRIPSNDNSDEGIDCSKLSEWSQKQRELFHGGILSTEKVRQLSALGFDFSDKEARKRRLTQKRQHSRCLQDFDEMMEELKSFKAEHGHCRVPVPRKNERDPSKLSMFVHQVRWEYRRLARGEGSGLSMERMTALTGIGFVFDPRGNFVPWTERIEACLKFKAENGHLKIPTAHPELGGWVRGVRKTYQAGKLSLKKKQQLDDLGFVWLAGRRMPPNFHLNKKNWSERFDEFVAYKELHGHPYVPQNHPGGLGQWTSLQRVEYKLMKKGQPSRGNKRAMSAERALKLQEAGFAFDASFICRTPKSLLDDIPETSGHE